MAEKIREVDEKRISDNEKLLDKVTTEIGRLGKTLSAPPKSGSSIPSETKPPVEAKPSSEKGYEYTIRSGDHPRVISQALAKQGVKVTIQQIMDANPKVDWTKLRIGQKIFIPAAPPL